MLIKHVYLKYLPQLLLYKYKVINTYQYKTACFTTNITLLIYCNRLYKYNQYPNYLQSANYIKHAKQTQHFITCTQNERIFIKYSIHHSNLSCNQNCILRSWKKTKSDFILAHSKTSDNLILIFNFYILCFIFSFLISIIENYLEMCNDININVI